MPSLAPNTAAKVLVTGANGYVALHVVDQLLKAGYAVRGTVRSAQKTAHLKKTFAEYGDKLEVVVVEDITQDGAFDDAVKGVEAVEHTASPFHTNFDDPQEAIGPAAQGTTSVLKSILKYGTAVKRVVVTSSVAAIVNASPEPRTFSEKDWNESSPRAVAELGRGATAMDKYRASKTLAERAAWDLWNAHKESAKWDLVTLNPSYVFGPVLHEIGTDTSVLNQSMLDWWNTVVKGSKNDASAAWIDVRDLGLAHRLALEKPAAGGERLITSAGSFKWQDWRNAANAVVTSAYPGLVLPKGDPSASSRVPGAVYHVQYDTSKTARILGMGSGEGVEIPYRTQEETARDVLKDAKERGWN